MRDKLRRIASYIPGFLTLLVLGGVGLWGVRNDWHLPSFAALLGHPRQPQVRGGQLGLPLGLFGVGRRGLAQRPQRLGVEPGRLLLLIVVPEQVADDALADGHVALPLGAGVGSAGHHAGVTEPTETAVLALVPEVEPVVGEHRRRLDPTTAAGVPAHVTVIYPFVPPGKVVVREGVTPGQRLVVKEE